MTPASNPYDGLIERPWLIFSWEHNAFWRPDECGYTRFIENAGRYSLEQAEKICAGAGYRTGPQSRKDEPPAEIMVADPVALSRLTRDVEARDAALEAIEASARGNGPYSRDRDADTLRAIEKFATLTRLSRPTELGADPAFVASQSSPSVSTKGFNRGEKGEGK